MIDLGRPRRREACRNIVVFTPPQPRPRLQRLTHTIALSVCLYAVCLSLLARIYFFRLERMPQPPMWVEYVEPPADEPRATDLVDLIPVPLPLPQTRIETLQPTVLPVAAERPPRLAVQAPPRQRSVEAEPEFLPEFLPQGNIAAAHSQFLLARTNAPATGGLEGRDPQSRARLIEQAGGSQASEDAVAIALAWIATHQGSDGGWRFNHLRTDCGGRCANRGTATTTTGATALALLPFLGAGHTHQEGDYQTVVADGLAYLRRRMRLNHLGGDLQEGTMYAQGIAAIALCEAFAMTSDEELREPAQQAIDFIVHAQHEAGGWRYFPGQPGDTTVFGWQMMALRSARLAGLTVPELTLARAAGYLDSVESQAGAGFGYRIPGVDRSPTAIGFLSRMYYGVPYGDERLRAGIVQLQNWGPSTNDIYFNYYATQVLHHFGGPEWETWNGVLREHLIASQIRQGHAAGSWFFPSEHAHAGGRLYVTAMAAMTLEVYYRHLPLYGEHSVLEEF